MMGSRACHKLIWGNSYIKKNVKINTNKGVLKEDGLKSLSESNTKELKQHKSRSDVNN